jgi:hypothetical protein
VVRTAFFPSRAGEMLLERFRREADPRTRAEIVRVAVHGSESVAGSEATGELKRLATSDPAPEVREALEPRTSDPSKGG